MSSSIRVRRGSPQDSHLENTPPRTRSEAALRLKAQLRCQLCIPHIYLWCTVFTGGPGMRRRAYRSRDTATAARRAMFVQARIVSVVGHKPDNVVSILHLNVGC